MPMSDPVLASFDRAAESAGDITAEVYERFYARSPESEQLMRHVDAHMQGRMLEELLELLMTAPEHLSEDYLRFETGNHRGYGVTVDQYRPLLEAVRDTIREALGDGWDERFAAAWEARIDALDRELRRHGGAAAAP